MSGGESFEGPTVVGRWGRTRGPGEGEPTSGLVPGERFGPYRVVALLGRGGIGEVYEVEHELLRKRFALKVLLAAADGPEARERFLREAQVAAALEHPRIVRVDDFGETAGRVWLRMELAAGTTDASGCVLRTLAERAARTGGRLPEAEVRDWLLQVLEALAHAHAAGVVHRDVKPGNVLIDEAGRAKLADFGLVQVVGERWLGARIGAVAPGAVAGAETAGTVGETARDEAGSLDHAPTVVHGAERRRAGGEPETEALVGTWDYMSPEQKTGGPVDARSDLYAVGLMAFRLLTGERVLGMEAPSELVAELDPAWDGWMRRAVAARPDRRFASAEEMRAALPVGHAAEDGGSDGRTVGLSDGGAGTEGGGQTTVARKVGLSDGGQRTEEGGRRAEGLKVGRLDGGQRTEEGGQTTVGRTVGRLDGGQKAEDGGRRGEDRTDGRAESEEGGRVPFFKGWRGVTSRIRWRKAGGTDDGGSADRKAGRSVGATVEPVDGGRKAEDGRQQAEVGLTDGGRKAVDRFERLRSGRFKAAVVDAVVPGLGHFLRGYPLEGMGLLVAAVVFLETRWWWCPGAVAACATLFVTRASPLAVKEKRLRPRVARFVWWYAVATLVLAAVLGAGVWIVLDELGHSVAPEFVPRPEWTRSVVADLAALTGVAIVATRIGAMLWAIVRVRREM
ncbi:hypothetical protein ASA1KI_27200 [Opitutales bacterium ASA1]|uniref:serine/threonine protein kinase n=1 Tax=Congregicoccus parvus TaxID=3081749 RepID=UPI002B2D8B9C|nr:hypothetical protein ASA1KI_27200 [Opitutales bacterium ASA1]